MTTSRELWLVWDSAAIDAYIAKTRESAITSICARLDHERSRTPALK